MIQNPTKVHIAKGGNVPDVMAQESVAFAMEKDGIEMNMIPILIICMIVLNAVDMGNVKYAMGKGIFHIKVKLGKEPFGFVADAD